MSDHETTATERQYRSSRSQLVLNTLSFEKNFKIKRKAPVLESLCNKVPVLQPVAVLKRDPGTGDSFLRILQKFSKKLIYRTPLNDCF